jgi:hypothetical protein
MLKTKAVSSLAVSINLLLYGQSTLAATPGDVVINEVAWMGTTNSTGDEWLELRNTTNSTIALSGWTLKSTDGTPNITLSGSIPANGVFLLERTDDTSVPSVSADQIYTGAMGNSGENMELRDASNALIDSVDTWHAGNNSSKTTMERIDPWQGGTLASNWDNATTSYGVGNGTPGAENSVYIGSGSSTAACNYPSTLEVTVINIGQSDATLIATPSQLMLADVGESYWNSHNDAAKVASVIHNKYGTNCNLIDYVVISHLHLDHIGYIQAEEDANGNLLDENGGSYSEGENLRNPIFWSGYAYLIKELGFEVGTTIIRDFVAHNPNKVLANGGNKTYSNWRAYLLSPDGRDTFKPQTAQLGTSQIDLGTINGRPVVVDIIQVDGATSANPNGCDPATYFGGSQYLLRGDRSGDAVLPAENDLSVAFILSFGKFQMFIGGDTSGENYESQWGYRYHDTETCLAEDSIVQQNYGGHLEVLRVNHHGSSHSTNQAFINAFAPMVSIFSVGDNNTHSHVDPAVRDRVLMKSVINKGGIVFSTESGADAHMPGDACHSTMTEVCIQVADGEFPTNTETDEAGDADVEIIVSVDGSTFTVQGNPGTPPLKYLTY